MRSKRFNASNSWKQSLRPMGCSAKFARNQSTNPSWGFRQSTQHGLPAAGALPLCRAFSNHLATASVSLLRYRARARRDTRRPCCSGPVGSDSTIRNPFFRAPPPRQFLSPPRKRVCAKWRAREPPLKAFAAKERTAAREVQVATAAASEGSARRHQGPPLALLSPSSATKRLAASRACSTRAPPGKQ